MPDPELLPDPDFETEPQKSGPKFWVAMTCYAVLAALAWLTLERELLWVVWIILGGLAVKTYIAKLQKP